MKKIFILFFMVIVANITIGCNKNEVVTSDKNSKQDVLQERICLKVKK